jgi:FSR family fosmidomycin resistance protein-like MFS transporter
MTPRDDGRDLDAVDRRSMTLLSSGHACVDACQGAVPAMLPFLLVTHDLSLTAATALVMAATVASTLVQPFFGAWSDRAPAPWLLPAGVVSACVGVALAGIAPSYPLVFAAVLFSGLGVAAYHPEGSRFANYVSGSRRATGMSYYSLGGNVGFALGPLMSTPLLLAFGLDGMLAFVALAAGIGVLLSAELRRLATFQPAQGPGRPAQPPERADDDMRGFLKLLAVICARSFAFYTLLGLVPLYFVEVLDASDATANAALAGMLVFGAIGTLVGGRLADRIGRRPVLVASLALQPPLLLATPVVGTVAAIVLACVLGFAAISSFAITVVMGQEYLPSRIGLASGFTLGAAIGLGGLAAPLFGWIGDAFSLATAMQTLAILPAAGALLAMTLPTAAMWRRRAEAAGAAATPTG